MALLRFLVIAFMIYLGFRLIVRYLLPLFGHYVVRKASERVTEQMTRQQQGRKVYQDNNMTIRKSDRSGKNASGTDEEYVDFQEID